MANEHEVPYHATNALLRVIPLDDLGDIIMHMIRERHDITSTEALGCVTGRFVERNFPDGEDKLIIITVHTVDI